MSLPQLNDAQTRAVEHRDGPCIVLAGPGAGKTAVLTRRAAALVQSGVQPERVLLLTFTRNSAREMLARAKAIEPACEHLSGGTFHSVATRVINRNAHVFGATKPFTILDPEDCREIVKKLIDPMKVGDDNWPRASTVHKVISFATNTRTSVEAAVHKLVPEHAQLVEQFQEVRDLYVSYKLERGLLDYDDCLEYLVALLQDEELAPTIRDQWDYVMVDEYQDTNAIQLEIVYGLAGDRENIMVVGDPSQSIYGFRGSAPATMAAFRQRFTRSEVIDLDVNYRSSSEIVAMVNSIDRAIDTGFERTLTSGRGASGVKPVLLEVSDDVAQAGEIAKAVLAHKEQGGEVSEVAVLVRSMSYARRIEVEFTSRKIPYKVVGGLRIDEAAHVKDLLSLARIATNVSHEPAWLRLLQRHARIGGIAAAEITDRVSILSEPSDAPGILEREATARRTDFEGLPDALRALMDQDRDPDLALADAVMLMEPFWKTIKEWKDDWDDRRRDIDAILLISSEHKSLEAFLTAITLDYSVDMKKSVEGPKEDEKPVTISTIHGAKGLEWPVVHIPSFVRGHMPSVFADDQEEEARILYVAVSRAMRELVIHKPNYDSKGGFAQASDFERLIRPFALVERASSPKMPSGVVASGKRIDMRNRLLGR
jgi:DNA helicase-2/ATP-dependent DNA helicase PcrA